LSAKPDLGPLAIVCRIGQADSHIAVKQVQSGIIAGDQDRSAGIPLTCSGIDQPAQLRVQFNDPSTGLTNGRQHPELIKGCEQFFKQGLI
jgi:hypothetical protein